MQQCVRARSGAASALVAAVVLVLAAVLAVPAAGLTAQEQLDQAEAAADAAAAEAAAAEAAAELAAEEVAALDEQAAVIAEQVLALRSQAEDARARLRAVDGQLALAADELEAREQALADSLAAEIVARQAAELATARLQDQQDALNDQVAAAYMLGGDATPAIVLRLLTDAETPADFSVGIEQLANATDYQQQVVAEAGELRAERERLVTASRDARRDAADAQRAADEAVAFAEESRDQQAAVTARLEDVEAEQAEVLEELEQDRDRAQVVMAAVDATLAAAEAEVRSSTAAVDAAARLALSTGSSGGSGVVVGTVTAGSRCPVVGAVVGRDFTNDWGYPRSGGRSHEGTDMFGDRHTPLVAVADGVVTRVRPTESGLGGRTVSISTGAGTTWYYAHLESVAAGLSVGQAVAEGQVLGTLGNSGNARSTPPHLHIGRYVNGSATNPYPILASRCT